MELYLLAEMENKERLTYKHQAGLEIPVSPRPQNIHFSSRTLIIYLFFLEVGEQWRMELRKPNFLLSA